MTLPKVKMNLILFVQNPTKRKKHWESEYKTSGYYMYIVDS